MCFDPRDHRQLPPHLPHIHRLRGIVTTLAPDGFLYSRGNTAAGELVIESCALCWRQGSCS